MENMKFLEDAVISQMKKLVQILKSSDLPNFVVSGANDELDKLLEFARKNKFTIPYDIEFYFMLRGL